MYDCIYFNFIPLESPNNFRQEKLKFLLNIFFIYYIFPLWFLKINFLFCLSF